MVSVKAVDSQESTQGPKRKAEEISSGSLGRDPLDSQNRGTVERASQRAVSTLSNLSSQISGVEKTKDHGKNSHETGQGYGETRED
jgi:hypothetical protein